MTTNWMTLCVLISSAFREMQAERDHLVRCSAAGCPSLVRWEGVGAIRG